MPTDAALRRMELLQSDLARRALRAV